MGEALLTKRGGKTPKGTAQAADVLEPETFSNDAEIDVVGTMPDIGAENVDISVVDEEVNPSLGKHDGAGVIRIALAEQAKILTGNIRAGVNILGVNGKTEVVDTSSADAVAAEILNGKKVYVDGVEVTGTMLDKAGESTALSRAVDGTTLKLLAREGYRDGVNDEVTTIDPDFIAANIKDAVNLFGLEGSYEGPQIASIQQIFTSFGNSVTTKDVTISAVDMSKTIIIPLGMEYSTSQPPRNLCTGFELTSTTNVKLTKAATGLTYDVSFMVVEFGGSVNSKQTGDTSSGSASITQIDLSKSMVVVSRTSWSTSTSRGYQTHQWGFTDDETLFFIGLETTKYYWQVIEFS